MSAGEDLPWFTDEVLKTGHALLVEKFAEHPEVQKALLEGRRLGYWCWKHKVLDLCKAMGDPTLFMTNKNKTTAALETCLITCENETLVLTDAKKTMDYLAKIDFKIVERGE